MIVIRNVYFLDINNIHNHTWHCIVLILFWLGWLYNKAPNFSWMLGLLRAASKGVACLANSELTYACRWVVSRSGWDWRFDPCFLRCEFWDCSFQIRLAFPGSSSWVVPTSISDLLPMWSDWLALSFLVWVGTSVEFAMFVIGSNCRTSAVAVGWFLSSDFGCLPKGFYAKCWYLACDVLEDIFVVPWFPLELYLESCDEHGKLYTGTYPYKKW